MPRRYRIEREAGTDPRSPGRAETRLRTFAAPPGPLPESAAGLAEFLAQCALIHDAVAATKRELAALEASPSGHAGVHRATGEVDAVSTETATAAETILDAVEEIELSAHLLRDAAPGTDRDAATAAILDRVLVLYEACHFADIAGQRLRRVTNTLRFVEGRLDALSAAWGSGPAPMPACPGHGASGPSLPGDPGTVSQADVDRYFN